MSDENKDELVVKAGYVTVQTQVGAGRAYVDVPQGSPLPADVSDEDRDRFLASGAVSRRGHDAPYIPTPRPVPGEVEPDEIDTDIVPGGTVEDILTWVGDDLARARVARHEEEAKGNHARANLLTALAEKMATVETEPPTVPEHIVEQAATPAPAGGVAVPDEDLADAEGKPAAKRTRTNRG